LTIKLEIKGNLIREAIYGQQVSGIFRKENEIENEWEKIFKKNLTNGQQI